VVICGAGFLGLYRQIIRTKSLFLGYD